MKLHCLIAATLCAAALACGGDEISGVADTSAAVAQPEVMVLYGFVTVKADIVTLRAVNGPSAVLVGSLVEELRELDGAFVIVRGGRTDGAPRVPLTLTVDSYELLDGGPEAE